jgi:hypothetical protein
MAKKKKKRKIIKVQNEGDMENAVKRVVDLALSDQVKKTINLWFPTGRFGAIFLDNCHSEMMLKNVPEQTDMNINIYINED